MCEYEFLKFCEFVYYILYYMIKYENKLCIEFFQFLLKNIAPILIKIRNLTNYCNTILFYKNLDRKEIGILK